MKMVHLLQSKIFCSVLQYYTRDINAYNKSNNLTYLFLVEICRICKLRQVKSIDVATLHLMLHNLPFSRQGLTGDG